MSPIVLVGVVLYLFISATYNATEIRFYDNEVERIELAYTEVLETYRIAFEVLHDEVLNEPEILEIFRRGNMPDEAAQNAARDHLYALLRPTYERLVTRNLRQLHFHLPDGTSFLRFHRPERYGDDLTGIRYTVTKANTEQVFVQGFEEGRIYNGFRYVYPLSYQGQHLGTVETSVSFNAIHSQMVNHLDGEVIFMLQRDVVGAKVFEDEQQNYIPANLSPDYVYDRNVIADYPTEGETPYTWDNLQAINTQLPANTAERLTNGESFAQYVRYNGQPYVMSFLPINNVQDQHVGYLVGYTPGGFVANNRNAKVFTLVISGLAVLFLGVFVVSQERGRLALASKNETLRQMNDALAQAHEKARAAEQVKARFLANMSHELRTPLNSIINFTELVALGTVGDINPQQYEHLNSAVESAEHLLDMINGIMDASKIEAGEMDLFMEEVDINVQLRSAIYMADALLADSDVQLFTEIQENLPLICADRRRVKQVFINLLANAVKFTTEGSITVTAQRQPDHVLVSVEDTGIGILPSERDRVFESFQQTTTGKSFKGTGLGMPIAKYFVEAHGGNIWFDSVPNIGTTFYVRLPIQSEPVSRPPQQSQLVGV